MAEREDGDLSGMPYYPDDTPASEAPAPKMNAAMKLAGYIKSPNLVDELKDDKATQLASRVCDDYAIDKQSRTDWETRTKAAMDLAMMVAETKDYPFAGASNVKFPLVTQGALSFNARAYPAIVQKDKVAKCKTYGTDADGQKQMRSTRVSDHLSWQLTAEMPEWEDDTDRMLVILPIVGCCFRKTFFDPSLGRKVSRLVPAENFVINYFARSIETAPRYTEELLLYPYEIEERIRDGRFKEFDYKNYPTKDEPAPSKQDISTEDDEDAQHLFLEQHRLYDLDGDGYPEPYVVTVHQGCSEVVRIVANYSLDTVRMTPDGSKVASIRKQEFFTRYLFLPSPDGGFYGMGLGTLLKDTNEAINTTLNELFDAGHLANIQGGFIASATSIREKKITIEKGTFKVINTGNIPIRDAIMPFQYPGPSEALIKLLMFMVDYGKELSSTTDAMSGETGGKVVQPMSLQILVEQGMKVFSAIFKRVYRAMTAELDIHARLNREHLTAEAYNEFFDDPQQQFDPAADYDTRGMDILPVADPEMATDTQALSQAQMIFETGADNPVVNQYERMKRVYTAAKVPDLDALLIPPQQPDPETEALMKRGAEAEVEEKEASAAQKDAAALKSVTDAQVATAGLGLEQGMALLNALETQHGMEMDEQNAAAAGAGGIPGMAGAPGDQAGAGPLPPQGGGAGVGQQAVPVPLGGPAPTPGMGGPPA